MNSFFSLVAEDRPTVLVSIAPYKFFVEQIAGDTITVQVMVPPGANAHAYEPTPKQMISASKALLWFILGESFERRCIPVVQGNKSQVEVVDLRHGIDLLSSGCCHCTHLHPDAMDLHLWLSPKIAKIQAQTIATALQKAFPNHAKLYESRLQDLYQSLDELHKEISTIMEHTKNRHILVSHPSFAYFCRDYNLVQLSVEFEGKDPTPKELTKTILEARKLHIDTVFIQRQFNNKGAKLVASTLQAKVIEVDPYTDDFWAMMRTIAHLFSGS